MVVGSAMPSGQLMSQTKPLFLLCRRPQTPDDYDSDSEASKRSGKLLRVQVNKQKVPEKRVEVNITPRDRRTALNLVPLLEGGGTNDRAFMPFGEKAGATWQRMRTLLGRLVGDKTPLWKEANAIGCGLGSHEFRRAEMDDIDSGDPTKKDALVRGIGADRNMVDKTYHDAKRDSLLRTEKVLENCKSLGVGPDGAAAPARVAATATRTRAQPAVNKGVTLRSREEAEQQAARDLESAREARK